MADSGLTKPTMATRSTNASLPDASAASLSPERGERDFDALSAAPALFAQTADAILVLDAAGRVRYANQAALSVFGLEEGRIAGLLLATVAAPDLAAAVADILSGQRTARPAFLSALKADGGEWRAVEASVSRLGDGAMPAGALVVAREHPGRWQALESLREREEQYRTWLERLPVLTYLHRPEGGWRSLGLVRLGSRFEALTGYPLQAWLDDPRFTYQIMHPADRARLEAYDRDIDRRGVPYAAEYRLIARDGHAVWVRDEAVLICNDQGERLYWLGVLIDITDLKLAEAETATALAELRTANHELARIGELRAEFFAAISHEFRTPLTSIQGFSELLQDDELSPEARQAFAATINVSAQRLARLIDGLLDLDHLGTGQTELRAEPIDVNQIAREVITLMQPALAAHAVVTQLAPALPVVRGDPDRLVQLVTNLMANAAKYSQPGTTITVTTGQADGMVVLQVRDQGEGIPADQLERIFDRYVRLPRTAQPDVAGNGLGLPIARQIAELHGGTLVAESDQTGSWFTLQLPIKDLAGENVG